MAQSVRIILFIFPAAVLFAALLPLYFRLKRGNDLRSAVAVKALCTLAPIIFCLNGCLINRFIGFWWILAGLVACLIGDVLIERSMISGMAAFLAAHGLFIYAFTVFSAPDTAAIPVFVILLAIAALIFRNEFGKMGKNLISFILYALVLFAMASLSLTLPAATGTALIAAGAVLFAVSDMMLAKGYLCDSGMTERGDVISLVFYYAGLYLFALAVWM